jgi:hypothetical protein
VNKHAYNDAHRATAQRLLQKDVTLSIGVENHLIGCNELTNYIRLYSWFRFSSPGQQSQHSDPRLESAVFFINHNYEIYALKCMENITYFAK